MTLILEIAAGLVAYTVILAFMPLIMLAGMAVLFLVVAISPELGPAGRGLALLAMFGTVWTFSKLWGTYTWRCN